MGRYFSEDRVSDYFGLAADETMALRVGKNQSLPILRLYTYRSNSALVGRFQRIENELNLNFWKRRAFPLTVVRLAAERS